MYVDMRAWDQLASEVPAEEITIDYTRLFGGQPSKHTPQTLLDSWKPLMEELSATQHTTA